MMEVVSPPFISQHQNKKHHCTQEQTFKLKELYKYLNYQNPLFVFYFWRCVKTTLTENAIYLQIFQLKIVSGLAPALGAAIAHTSQKRKNGEPL
jgi:hypothetical protein